MVLSHHHHHRRGAPKRHGYRLRPRVRIHDHDDDEAHTRKGTTMIICFLLVIGILALGGVLAYKLWGCNSSKATVDPPSTPAPKKTPQGSETPRPRPLGQVMADSVKKLSTLMDTVKQGDNSTPQHKVAQVKVVEEEIKKMLEIYITSRGKRLYRDAGRNKGLAREGAVKYLKQLVAKMDELRISQAVGNLKAINCAPNLRNQPLKDTFENIRNVSWGQATKGSRFTKFWKKLGRAAKRCTKLTVGQTKTKWIKRHIVALGMAIEYYITDKTNGHDLELYKNVRKNSHYF